jgi:HTH-type transcriptional regulator/antitoxin HipB
MGCWNGQGAFNSALRMHFEAFKLGLMLQELRKGKGLTQQQLADRCGTTKNYISRIENDASDIRLSTLMRIVADGLGATLRLSVG